MFVEISQFEYRQILKPHKRVIPRLLLDLQFYLEDIGPVVVISISRRFKKYKSAIKKAKSLGIHVNKLNDLAGIRIVAGTTHDLKVIERFFSSNEFTSPCNVVSDERAGGDTGYRARHIIIEEWGMRPSSFGRCQIEIQLQTTFEHAFNMLSRQWIYKSGRMIDAKWSEQFKTISELLAVADARAAALQDELFKHPEVLLDNDPINPLAYQTILEECHNEKTDFNTSVEHSRNYRRNEIKTCGELREYFRNAEIKSLYEDCLATMSREDIVGFEIGTKQEFWCHAMLYPHSIRQVIAMAAKKRLKENDPEEQS